LSPSRFAASPAQNHRLAALPGAPGDEEMLMDDILADAGMVFDGAGIMHEPCGGDSLHCSGSLSGGPSFMCAGVPSLGEELRGLGLGDLEDLEHLEHLEDLEEQEALLQSFQGEPCPAQRSRESSVMFDDLSVEDLLDNFDGSIDMKHEASIEVF